MPQFDQFSFLNQVIFFVLFFFSVYFIITYFLIPNLNSVFKLRVKKIINHLKSEISFLSEINKDQKFINNNYQSTFLNSELFIKKNINQEKSINFLQLNLFKNKINLFLNNYYLF